jgi:hypothetical protein
MKHLRRSTVSFGSFGRGRIGPRWIANGAFAIVCLLSISTSTARDIQVGELLANPQQFEGRRVAVIGYYVAATETSCLFSTRDAAKRFDILRSVWVEFRNPPAVDSIAGRRARLVGTFHYTPSKKGQALRKYGNLWSAAILDVTEFRPVK